MGAAAGTRPCNGPRSPGVVNPGGRGRKEHPCLQDPEPYAALRDNGASQQKPAGISNAAAKEGGYVMKPGTQRPNTTGENADGGRNETVNERRDRQWDDLLQELRVMQTGTQIIAGFLLTLPFQARFSMLDGTATALYLCTVVLAALTTCWMLVPVAMHRELFGLRIKDRLVTSGHHVVRTALWLIGLLVVGTTALVFDVVLGRAAAVTVAALFAAFLLAVLVAYPRLVRSRKQS